MFRRETETLARLTHPNIAALYEAGRTDDGQHFFTMELVLGETLAVWARRRLGGDTPSPAQFRERLRQVVTICRGVNYAHQRGVIHRDLKPSNIVVGPNGNPKVLDFGLAKITDADLALTTMQTRTGQLLGTIAYMSPEQVTGDGAEVDFRCDVYALGVVLYELLSGRLPIEIGSRAFPQALKSICDDDPPPLGAIDRALRGDLETIAAKALEKDRTRRYASVSELAGDVERVLRHEPIAARPASTIYTVKKFARRNRALVAGGVSAVAALIVGLGIAVAQAVTATRARDELALEQKRSEFGEYVANVSAAEAALRSGDAAGAATFLDAAPAGLRGWEWWELEGRVDLSELTLTQPTGVMRAIAASPTSSLVVVAGYGGIHGFEPGTWRRVWDVSTDVGSLTAVSISADGRWLVAAGPGGASMWRLDPDAPPRFLGRVTGSEIVAVRFAGTGATAWIASRAGRIEAWDGGVPLPLAWQPGVPVRSLEASSDGRFVAVGTTAGAFVLDSNGSVLGSTPEGTPTVLAAAFDRRGDVLAAAGADRSVQLWALEGGRPVRRIGDLLGHTAEITSVAFSAAGDRVISSSADRSVRIWTPGKDPAEIVLTGHRAGVHAAVALSDGRIVSSSEDRTIKVWNLERLPPRTLPGCHGVLASDGTLYTLQDKLRWSWRPEFGPTPRSLPPVRFGLDAGRPVTMPCGRLVVGARDLDSSVHLVDLIDASPHSEPGCGRGPVWEGSTDFALSPDGRKIALPLHRGAGKVLDAASGDVLGVWSDPGAAQVHPAFSPDSTRLASLSTAGAIVVRDASTCAPLLVLRGHGSDARCVAFSPDGTLIATGSLDRTARLWSARTGETLRILRGHGAQVESLAFTPDGRRLATGSFDGTVRLWDVAAGREVASLRTNAGSISEVRFSGDGAFLLAPSGSGPDWTVNVWHAGSEARRLALSSLEDLLLPERVIARLKADPSSSSSLRDEAIRVVGSLRPDAGLYNSRAWAIVGSSGADAAACEHALRLADAACALDPTNGYFLNTLGAAQYRCGLYDDALKTLAHAQQVNGAFPPDLAFIVMCHARQGDVEAARVELARARASFDRDLAGGEPQALMNEAESVVRTCGKLRGAGR
jgi:WD40 repeat protein